MILKSQQNRIELVARPGKSVQKGQIGIAGSTKVKRIKIALVFRPDPKKPVARPSKECCRQASKPFECVLSDPVAQLDVGVDCGQLPLASREACHASASV